MLPCMAVSFGQFRVIFLVRVSGHLCLLQPAAVMHRQGTFGWNLGAVASLHGKNDCRCLGKNGTYRIHKTTFVQIYIKTNLDHSSNSLLSMCFTKNTLHSPCSATYLQKEKKKITCSVEDCWTKDSAYICARSWLYADTFPRKTTATVWGKRLFKCSMLNSH